MADYYDDGGGEEDNLNRILAEIETLDPPAPNPNPSSTNPSLSEPTLASLLSLSSSPTAVAVLFDRLPSLTLLLSPLTSSMDSSSSSSSLLAARAYLSLLLSPSSPLLSLFTPLSFLSLLRAVRRSVKSHQPTQGPSSSPPSNPNNRKKRKGADRSGRRADHCGGDNILEAVLELLNSVVNKVRLDVAHDGRKFLVETIITVLESGGNHRTSDLCFKILYGVVSRPEHGDQLTSAVEVLKNLTPLILLPAKSPLKTLALGFVTGKMVPLGTENEKVRKALVYLPRFLVSKAPERSEPRAAAVESILEIVKVMEEEDMCLFVDYLLMMCEGKASLRLLAVDIILGLLTSLRDPLRMEAMEEEGKGNWGVKCLKALLRRCDDSMGGIRARALTNLAQVIGLLSEHAESCSRLQNIVASGKVGFNQLLRERCVDEKAAVRKATLLLITKSMDLVGRPIDNVVLKTMSSACSDPLVSIRKAALVALSEVIIW